MIKRRPRIPFLGDFAPSALADKFGVATVARSDGSYGFAYYLNDNQWSDDMIAGTLSTMESALGEAGYRKITGRVFRGADYPHGLAVSINF